MIRPEPFTLADYRVAYLQNGDLPALQDLLERCGDYIELTSGSPPSPAGAENILTDRPAGKDLEAKFVIGVSLAKGALIAVVDMVRDYPGEGDWWLGLLLVDPHSRSQGLGRSLYTACENWACAIGGSNMLLGVFEANPRAYRFCQSLGFEMLEKRPPAKFSERQQTVIVMKRPLK